MIFKLNSNHHKTSYMVCRSLLGVHRAHFHQEITFSATSGRMPINFEKHQKFQKSPKFRFFAKIRFLMEWPILAGMMIYGRKWTPQVFQSSFAPGFDILIHLDHILSNFEKIDFLKFFICGFAQNRPRRNFYGCRNFEIMLETCSGHVRLLRI